MGFRNDLRSIHYGEQRCACGGHFPGIQRPIGDPAINGAVDLRVTEQGFCSGVFPLRGLELAGGATVALLVAKSVERVVVALG